MVLFDEFDSQRRATGGISARRTHRDVRNNSPLSRLDGIFLVNQFACTLFEDEMASFGFVLVSRTQGRDEDALRVGK